jgi:hypothetical protein
LAFQRANHGSGDPIAGRLHDRVVEGPIMRAVGVGVVDELVHPVHQAP